MLPRNRRTYTAPKGNIRQREKTRAPMAKSGVGILGGTDNGKYRFCFPGFPA